MINLREHLKISAVYTFFAVFPALLQLIVYPVIEGEARLGPTDFGYLAVTEAVISLVFLLCTFGMGSGISRFYYDHKDDPREYGSLVSTIIGGILGRGLLLMGFVLLLGSWIGQLFPQPELQDFGKYGPSLVISGLNRSLITTLLILYRNEKRVQAFVVVSFFAGIFRSGFQLAGVFLYDLSFLGYVYGTAAGGTIVALVLTIYTYHNCGFHYKRSLLKALHKFTGPLFLTELIYWGLLFGDRFFLINNPEQLGIYDNAMKFAIGIQMIIQGLTSAVQPEVFRYFKEGYSARAAETKTLSNIFIAESAGIIALAIVPVMIFINLFYETELSLSSGLVSIVFIRFILHAQYQVFSWPVMYRKKTAVFLYINIIVLVLNLGINWLITPTIGYYGAIIAFLTAYTVQVVTLRYIQNKIAPVDLNAKKVIYFPLGMIAAAVFLEIAKIIFSINPFITSSILVIIILLGLALLYGRELSKSLRGKSIPDDTSR